MKHTSLIAFLVIVSLLSGGYILGLRFAGQAGAYLAQGYMLIPAIAALITRLFFDERRFTDVNLRFGRWKDYLLFWLFSLGIATLFFIMNTLLRAGHWDLSGTAYLSRLEEWFAITGQRMSDSLPPGMTPQMMLFLFVVGGMTVFNIPGLLTGFGEEFGWRGLLLPRLYIIRPWVAFVIGGLIWYAWHLPLSLIIPQEAIAFAVPVGSAPQPGQQAILTIAGAISTICSFTYLSYVYARSRSILVTALAHIATNNAAASFGYLFVLESQFRQGIGVLLSMLIVVGVLYISGQFKLFRTLGDPMENGG